MESRSAVSYTQGEYRQTDMECMSADHELLAAARAATAAAAGIHRAHLGRVAVDEWTEKGAADFVTHVDRAAEAAIGAAIRSRFPDHLLLAEEAASERGTGSGVTMEAEGWVWIVDPLDGTTNYLHGYPMYAVSVAVALHGVLQAGVVLNTASGQEWSAVRGGGAFQDGRRISVSEVSDLSRALIGTGFPFKALQLLPAYTRQLDTVLRRTAGVRRAGSAAIDLCHVASGFFDGFWELNLEAWDVAAGTLIVREAGGVVTRLDGSRDVLGTGSILAGNTVIHEALGALVRDPAPAAQPAY
jgi:myo-inositol-1(or 4)-monophosphatase